MRIIKPLTLSLLARPFVFERRHRLAIGAVAFFDLPPPGGAASERLRAEAEMWAFIGDRLGETPFDAGMPKARPEVVVSGDALAPGGRPVPHLDVSVEVAREGGRRTAKLLRVSGDRYWGMDVIDREPVLSPPRPFTEMPLTFERAFGGAGHPTNPDGRGHDAVRRLARGEPVALPNVEDRRHLIATPRDVSDAKILGPIELTAPQRLDKAGTFDETWLEQHFPGMPPDADWTIFNVTQRDQWLADWLSGDERFAVHGMNRDHAVVGGSLPGMRFRCLVQQSRGDGTRIREVTLRNETLWLFPNDRAGILIARGIASAALPDAEDVTTLLLAYERMADAPRPAAHYEQVMRLRSDPATKHLYVMAESQITPPPSEAETARREAARRDARAALDRDRRGTAEAMIERIFADKNKPVPPRVSAALATPAEAPIDASRVPVITEADIAAFDIDLAGTMEAIEALKTQAKALAEAQKAKAEAQRESAEARLIARAGSREAYDAARAAQQMDEVRRRVTAPLPADGLDRTFDIDALLARGRRPADEVLSPERRAETAARLAEARQRIAEARRIAPAPTVPAAPLAPAAAALLGRLVRERVAAAESLAGRDLAGADLAGADLSGADLREAMLERADLTGATLHGARCAGATFAGATMTRAVLAGADLAGANLSEADLTEADLEGAILTGARLMKTVCDGAHLARARLDGAQAIEARLAGARLPGAVLDTALLLQVDATLASFVGAQCRKTMFVQATLTDADFMEAQLAGAMFLAVSAERIRLSHADLSGVLVTSGSCLRDAVLRRAEAAGSGWHGVDLGGADFGKARLDGVDLGQARLAGANLRRASLRRALLIGADLTDARVSRADLMEAKLSKARLTRADLRSANLYAADLIETLFDETRVHDANVARTRLAR